MRQPWVVGALTGMLTRKCLFLSPFLRRRFSTASSLGGGVAVKKVTRSNFESALDLLRVLVRESDFVAVDLEMTGVTSAPWRESFEFDRSDVRYLKVKDSAEKFAVVQVGVCPFRWDESKESFVAHPHNFYVFPRKELPIDGPSYEFLCQTTSIDFLTKYQFDFNAWIYEGISYLSRAQEVEAICALSSAYDNILVSPTIDSREPVDIPIVSIADVLFLERMKNRFHEWRIIINKDPIEDPLRGNPDSPKPQFQTIFYKMRPAVLLSGFSSHQHKMIQLVTRKHFNDLVFVRASCADFSGQKIVVYAESDDDKALLMKEVREDLKKMTQAKIRSAVGFRHVIDLLATEQKLVIGHNCFLDIAHLYNKFFGSLPSSITEFASSVHKIFPHIVDTRHLLNASPVIQYLMKKNSKSLSSAFALLCPQIFSASYSTTSASHPCVKVEVQTEDTGSSCWNSGAKHEAGYDAFMTGCVFAQACSHLGIDFKLDSPSMELVRNDKLQKHINRLYLGWNNGTTINLTTGSELPENSDIQSQRRRYPKIVFENIVIVWGFPSKFKPKELKECICKVFGQSSVTSIFYLDATAAFIQFSKQELVTDFLLLKDSLERKDDAVSVLHPLVELLEGGNTRAAGYDVYKQVCSSSVSEVLFVDQADAVLNRWKTKLEPVNVDTEDPNPATASVVEPVRGKKKTVGGREPHHSTCEEILGSLYASKSLFGRRTST